MRTEELPKQNPLNLICFIIVEFQNIKRPADIHEKFPEGNFFDISSDLDVIQQWKGLGLTDQDKSRMLKFNIGDSSGEMELIFRDDRLVQSGIQLFCDSSNIFPIHKLYEAVKEIIGLNYFVEEVSSSHIMFSNNIINGYLHTPSESSLAFRVAELKWCESVYGPNCSIPL